MTKNKKNFPPIVHLNFSKGDLIIKEGDYGISIYNIISGKIGVFVESEGMEVNVAMLGPGRTVGEMTFLAGNTSPRSASARALEDCCLEVWHPDMLLNTYKQMPGVLRLIVGHTLKLTVRMNKMVVASSLAKGPSDNGQTREPSNLWEEKRKFYRKKVNMECFFRPVNSSKNLKLLGRINNISKGGLQVTANTSDLFNYTLASGDDFFISTYLMPDQKVHMTAKIVWLEKEETKNTICMKMAFIDIDSIDQQRLGFFLMP